MQTYIEAPNETKILSPSIFLAGGITDCEDWQTKALTVLDSMLVGFDHTILNPRRSNFDTSDKSASRVQIDWEYRHLRLADTILFWFPSETLCPITLYELGAIAMTFKPLAVGCHPQYKRLEDVRVQLELQRPDTVVHTDFHEMLEDAAKKLTAGKF
jgi:hypothetical protein